MIKIVIGTTPTIKYKFSVVDPADFAEAILTIKDSRKQEKLRKTLDTATVEAVTADSAMAVMETACSGTSFCSQTFGCGCAVA